MFIIVMAVVIDILSIDLKDAYTDILLGQQKKENRMNNVNSLQKHMPKYSASIRFFGQQRAGGFSR